jgi:hypothetical protein
MCDKKWIPCLLSQLQLKLIVIYKNVYFFRFSDDEGKTQPADREASLDLINDI